MKQKVGISYGWSEGSWHGKLLRKELKQAGFTITRNLKKADVLIAHSGGCFLLPEASSANTIMLVGMPHWPGKKITHSFRDKMRLEVKNIRWFKKMTFNTLYLLLKPVRWIRMYRGWKKYAQPSKSKNRQVLFIKNSKDSFIHPIDSEIFANENGWRIASLQGEHDDIWHNPNPYVDLLVSQLAQKV